MSRQIETLGITGSSIGSAIGSFLNSLGWSDIFSLGSVWQRAKSIITTPISRILGLVRRLSSTTMRMVKDAILQPLAQLAEGTQAYDLLRMVLGRDPITNIPYPAAPGALIGGFMKLIGQEEVWNNIKKGNANKAFKTNKYEYLSHDGMLLFKEKSGKSVIYFLNLEESIVSYFEQPN